MRNLVNIAIVIASVSSVIYSSKDKWILMENCEREIILSPGGTMHLQLVDLNNSVIFNCEMLIKTFPGYVIGYYYKNETANFYDYQLKEYLVPGKKTQILISLKRKLIWREAEAYFGEKSLEDTYLRSWNTASFLADGIMFSLFALRHKIAPTWPLAYTIISVKLEKIYNPFYPADTTELLKLCMWKTKTFYQSLADSDHIYVLRKYLPTYPESQFFPCTFIISKKPVNDSFYFHYRYLADSQEVVKRLLQTEIKLHYLDNGHKYQLFLHLKGLPDGVVLEQEPPYLINGIKLEFLNSDFKVYLSPFSFAFRLTVVKYYKGTLHKFNSVFSEMIPHNPLSFYKDDNVALVKNNTN